MRMLRGLSSQVIKTSDLESHHSPAVKPAPPPDCSLRKKVLPYLHSEFHFFSLAGQKKKKNTTNS